MSEEHEKMTLFDGIMEKMVSRVTRARLLHDVFSKFQVSTFIRMPLDARWMPERERSMEAAQEVLVLSYSGHKDRSAKPLESMLPPPCANGLDSIRLRPCIRYTRVRPFFP